MEVTVAFLPFKSLITDQRLDMLMAGFVDDLIINLSKFTGLKIISPESTREFSNLADIHQLPDAILGYTITGNARPVKLSLRVAIQLIRNQDGKVVFAHDYTAAPEELFDIQDQIIRQLVNVLQQSIDRDILSTSYQKPNTDLRVYELYLMGMEALKKGGLEYDLQARQYFENALELNPHYARAYTGLSLSYFNEWSCQLWDRWEVSQKGAHDHALKALALDGNDYQALAVAGRTYLFSSQYEVAEECLRKSLQVNPNDAWNMIQIAFSMMYLGLAEEAVELYETACKLNPMHADNYLAYGSNIYFEFGDFQKCLDLGRRVDHNNAWVDFPVYLAAACHFSDDPHKMHEYWNLYLESFRKHISKTQISSKEALTWHIKVNPYKDKTNLQSFWDYMFSKQEDVRSFEHNPITDTPGKSAIRQRGDVWEVDYKGERVMLKDSKGLRDICQLLQRPDEDIHCSELAGTMVVVEQGIEMFDHKAKAEYKKHIVEIQNSLREAETVGDSQEAERLHWEYEQVLNHISKASGLGRKARVSATSVDKIRSAVTLRIKGCIKKISKAHPALGKHLALSIKTGTFCAYRPEEQVSWIME